MLNFMIKWIQTSQDGLGGGELYVNRIVKIARAFAQRQHKIDKLYFYGFLLTQGSIVCP